MTTKRIMTKKEKFRDIASEIFDIIRISNYFSGRSNSLGSNFNDSENKTYSELWRVYMEGLEKKHHNNPEYDHYIEKALGFIGAVVEKYVPKEQREHGNGSPFTLDFLREGLDFDEVEDWKKGSSFTCILSDDIHVKRLPLETDENGNWKNHLYGLLKTCDLQLNFEQEVANLSEGLYQVVQTGERFDIWERWGSYELSVEGGSESYNHTIIDKFETEGPIEENVEIDFYNEHDDHECSRCRGGDCPSCDKTGFFTGFPLY